MVVKDVGYELRCVSPNAFDQDYTRDLGAGAVATLLSGTSNVMITRQSQRIVALPFDDILDPQTLGVVLHEIAHLETPEHDHRFIDRLQLLAGQTAKLFAEEGSPLAAALRAGDPDHKRS